MITQRRRVLSLTATAAVVALGVSACASDSGADDPDATSPETVESISGEVSFGNWQWLEEGRGDRMWEAVSQFADEHSDVTLVKSETPFAQYADKLNTELGAGAGPDVFIVLDRQYATLAEAGVLEPLDGVVATDDLNSTNDNLVIGDERLGVTWEQVSYGLLCNKNVMAESGIEELPTTVDELIDAGQKAVDAGFEGFAVRHQMNEFNGWAYDFPSWVVGFGGGWSDGEQLTIDSPENIQGLEEYKRVFDSGIVPTGDDASTFRSKFKENQLACIIDNSGTPNALSVGGAITGEDIASGPLPFPEPGAHQKLILAVNANSDNKDAAKALVSWLTSADGQEALRPSIGAAAMATDIPIDAAYLEEMPWAAAYEDIGKTSRSGIPLGFENRSDEIMREVLSAVERVVIEGADPAEELARVQEQLS